MNRKRGGDLGQLGAFLRSQRRSSGLTQQALADSAGLSVGMIRDLEQDRTRRPYRGSIDRLAKALALDSGVAQELIAARLPWYGERKAENGNVASPLGTASHSSSGLRIRVLGPLTVWQNSVPIHLGGPKQRLLLAVLTLYANTWIHRNTLVDIIWQDNPPASAVDLVQTYAARLRRLLCSPKSTDYSTGVLLMRSGSSYRFQIPEDRLDLLVLDRLSKDARLAFASGDVAAACDLYERAAAMWHAEPLCDIDELRNTTMIEGLFRKFASTVIEFAEACFIKGWYGRSLTHVEQLTRRDPLDERAQACLMIALAGLGQQAAALNVYHTVRTQLAEQLGILPSSLLSTAYERILRKQIK